MGDFTLHLSCITNKMLHVFAAAGHHNNAKASHLYVQIMKTYENGPAEEIVIISMETMLLGIQAMSIRCLVFGVI